MIRFRLSIDDTLNGLQMIFPKLTRIRQGISPYSCILLLIALAGRITLLEASQEPDRPNFLLIFTDDQGLADVGCYGSEIPTPNIDTLARDGIQFQSWYVASSICTPSRFGLLTGRNPSRSQDELLGALMFLAPQDKQRGIRSHETTIATALSRHGYHCGLVGKWHLGHGDASLFPQRHGFAHTYGHTAGCVDFYTMSYGNTPDWYRNGRAIEQTGYATDLITDEAVSFIQNRQDEKPFFLYLAYNAPHFGKGWDDGNDVPVNILQPPPADLERVRFIKDPTRRKFAAKVTNLDDNIGRVLATLEREKLDESTVVIFMTDHGGDPNYGGRNTPYRAGKATLFEGGVRVPCLMRWPGKFKAGTKSQIVGSALDIFPTFASLAKIPIPEGIDGIDISQALLDGAKIGPRDLFWELGPHAELDRGQWRSLRSGDWKYVQSPTEGEWLFNLANDPFEKENLRLKYPERFQKLRARAREQSERYREKH